MSRFKFIKQKDSMQCGVACLAMIASYYGKSISLDSLSQVCHPTVEGVSLVSIMHGASSLGFKTLPIKATLSQLLELHRPCIIHWNQNHFVVFIEETHKGQIRIADPAKGIVEYSRSEFRVHWTSNVDIEESKGIALLLDPNTDFETVKIQEKKDLKRNPFSFLFKYIIQYRTYLFQISLGLLLGCVLQLILPFLTQWIVDYGIKYNDIGLIWLILLGELMIIIGRTATDFVRRWLLLHISMRINISLVSDFFIKLLKLPMSFFDTKLMGDLLQRINDHTRVQDFLTGQVLSIIFSLLSLVVFGVVLCIYNTLIFAIFCFATVIYAIWIVSFLKKRQIIDYELFGWLSSNQDITYQFLTAMQEIKLQDCESRRRWEWEDNQADLFAVQMKSLKLQQTQEAGSIFINEVKNIIITVLAATSVINGQMTLGAMLAVQYIIGQLNSPVEQLMSFIYSLQDVKISLERINEIHNGNNEETNDDQMSGFGGDKSISLSHIDFKYDPHSKNKILSDVSFEIPAGKITAIVGASGSGKTTLIKLMLGYYPVMCGCLSISERRINDYNLKWWRRQCGVVMQDGVIFSESIARNIAVADKDIDYKRLEFASKIANIYDFVTGLPLKFDTKIGKNGVGLSQGQKQRILIARAVYKDPDFIFLDEATNALDAENERSIVENLNEFYKGRTVVVVAHRLSTVKNADQIIVMANGTVVESGDHFSLIQKKGVYFNLVKNQLELGN